MLQWVTSFSGMKRNVELVEEGKLIAKGDLSVPSPSEVRKNSAKPSHTFKK